MMDNGISCVIAFRIHEFNVQQVMALFLPYHESPHFAKMLTILQIQ
jgi:U3 small nucleolar RNA-associated protein 10